MALKEALRQSILNNHEFLLKLYTEKPHTVKRILRKTSNSQLCILIKLIYALEEGLIPMKIRHYKTVIKSKRMKPILLLKYNVKSLLRSSLSEKKHGLTNFVHCINHCYIRFLNPNKFFCSVSCFSVF